MSVACGSQALAGGLVQVLFNDLACKAGAIRCMTAYSAAEVDALLAARKQADDAQIAAVQRDEAAKIAALQAEIDSLKQQPHP
jgi:hypothetical protein